MIYDAILAFFEQVWVVMMGSMSLAMGSPPDWTVQGIAATEMIMSRVWGLNYWVPFEWVVPIGIWVTSVRFPLFVIRVGITIWNLVRGAGG
jgi:hypothetical protein